MTKKDWERLGPLLKEKGDWGFWGKCKGQDTNWIPFLPLSPQARLTLRYPRSQRPNWKTRARKTDILWMRIEFENSWANRTLANPMALKLVLRELVDGTAKPLFYKLCPVVATEESKHCFYLQKRARRRSQDGQSQHLSRESDWTAKPRKLFPDSQRTSKSLVVNKDYGRSGQTNSVSSYMPSLAWWQRGE